MPHRSVHVIQMFDRRDGQLVAGDREITTREAAERRARMLAALHAGAAVISLSDDDRGSRNATVLVAFGDVPGSYAESRIRGWSMEPISRS